MKARVIAGLVIILIAIAIIGGVFVLSGKAVSNTPNQASNSSGNVKEFNMTASAFQFDPSTITVNEGDTVILHIKSLDEMHGIGIPQFNVSEFLPPGQEVTVQFVADKKGSFKFFCNVPCGEGHRDMTGMIVVN